MNIPINLQSSSPTDILTVSLYDKRLNKFYSIQKIPIYKLNMTNIQEDEQLNAQSPQNASKLTITTN